MSSINVAKEIETKARELFPLPDVYYDSSGTPLFSSSSPVLLHKKLNPNELDICYQSIDNACLSLNKFHLDAEGNDPLSEDEDHATGSFLPHDEDELGWFCP
ncbi:protein MEI2-like 5 [Forsythia ovata]|uniref:Protein MEI2-like 5 n=1 Tax=Forsythia ovata TaxID=205694 RepID=A0ABD1W8R7_9LAMI